MYIFLLVLGGGKINRPGQLGLSPGGENNQGWGQDIPGQLAPPRPGGQANRGWLAPGGQAVQGAR